MIEGNVIKYEERNINTDLIIPARYLNKSDAHHLAAHCMEDLDPKFHEKKKELNASILVAGANFGSGSSREQAPVALKAAGIKCIIAPSYARIFFRNSINIALPLIEFSEIDELHTADKLQIDLEGGSLVNNTTGKNYSIPKMPQFLQELLAEEGLINFGKKMLHQ